MQCIICNKFYIYLDYKCSVCYKKDQEYDLSNILNTMNISMDRNQIIENYRKDRINYNNRLNNLLKYDITKNELIYMLKSFYFLSDDIINVYNIILQKFDDNILLNVLYSRVLDRWNLNNEYYIDVKIDNIKELKKIIDGDYDIRLLEYEMNKLNA